MIFLIKIVIKNIHVHSNSTWFFIFGHSPTFYPLPFLRYWIQGVSPCDFSCFWSVKSTNTHKNATSPNPSTALAVPLLFVHRLTSTNLARLSRGFLYTTKRTPFGVLFCCCNLWKIRTNGPTCRYCLCRLCIIKTQ